MFELHASEHWPGVTVTYLAITNNSRTILEPSPMNFCTNSDPETRINVHSVWWATARASRVLPTGIKKSICY
jgi:hypothetical protein